MRRKLLNIISVFLIIVSSCTVGFFGYPLLNEPETKLQIETLDSATVSNIISTSITQNYLPQDTAFKILNATVRIGTTNGQASGIIVYSRPNPDDSSVWTSYILTNYHVVKSNKEVDIETFNYLRNRQISETITCTGKVIAKSRSLDLAVIETITTSKVGEEAQMLTYEELEKCKLYSPIYISACPLGNTPFITNGNIGHIAKKHYLVTAFSIFGSSGGGVFTADGGLLGLASKIGKFVDNKGADQPLPNLSHIIPVNRIAKWLDYKGFSFIVEKDTEAFVAFLKAKKSKSKFFR